MHRVLMCLAFVVLAATACLAVEPDEILAEKTLEHRARALSAGLRCLVCQNQSIDDSNAPLARDLRIIIRERLKAGDSDGEVKDFVVSRYGEFVLLKPPLNRRTLLLWSLPFLLLLAAVAFMVLRRTHAPASREKTLTAEEKQRLTKLLKPPPS